MIDRPTRSKKNTSVGERRQTPKESVENCCASNEILAVTCDQSSSTARCQTCNRSSSMLTGKYRSVYWSISNHHFLASDRDSGSIMSSSNGKSRPGILSDGIVPSAIPNTFVERRGPGSAWISNDATPPAVKVVRTAAINASDTTAHMHRFNETVRQLPAPV